MQVQTRMAETLPRASAPDRSHAGAPAARSLRQEALVILEQFGTSLTVRRGHHFYAAGDLATFGYRIARGTVRTVEVDAEGQRQITEFLLPPDLLGFDTLGAHHLSAEAVTETVVTRYPRRLIDSLAEQHSALALRLRDIALQTLQRAHETMFLLGRKSAGERIAAFLLALAEHGPGHSAEVVELPMTRGDIADHLGLTIETVSRTMAQLGRDGTIAVVKSWASRHNECS
jgi:CRP/FNR family nitrogen fixation transcriptional regulator